MPATVAGVQLGDVEGELRADHDRGHREDARHNLRVRRFTEVGGLLLEAAQQDFGMASGDGGLRLVGVGHVDPCAVDHRRQARHDDVDVDVMVAPASSDAVCHDVLLTWTRAWVPRTAVASVACCQSCVGGS
ncbi:hypothetical protein E1265_26190 [Streptomyces sp. 8K308]|uniref:hypothetical protein n=1 Tax=Streptomyces sp. 8K308 TaxID=2530388 RepID=UPI0010502CD8|nr:hypothetical protein [Streptomyces sp. 8K308]TDC15816.1 hypothetical protein E1265_26190 [Streptomyces sp. 8K308]